MSSNGNFRTLRALCLAILLTASYVTADDMTSAANRLKTATGGNVAIQYSTGTGAARFVRATNDATIPVPGKHRSLSDKAFAFMEQYGAVFGIGAARQELKVYTVVSDSAGSTVRLAQQYGILPVFGALLSVHFDPSGAVTAANGTFVPGVKVPRTPVISADEAKERALNAVATAEVPLALLQATAPDLGVTKAGLAQDVIGPQFLAWRTTVEGPSLRKFVILDALSGAVIEIFEGIHTARNRQNFNMLEQSNYDLAVRCRFENDSPSNEPDCDNSFIYAGDTYDFFWNGFRRDSFDARGAALKSYVHYFSTICPNAFWNGSVMTYCTAFPHDDVAGHEITHGVTEFSSNLVYAYQPGALNESFSDIFGESIDLMNSTENEPGTRWQIGEGIVPGGLRDMMHPEVFGDPDAADSPNYSCSASDSGGVHTNSGVPNKAYALMVDGGTHNGVTVTGIGLNRAAAVQYRVNNQYLSTFSNFAEDHQALLAACRDLRNKRLNDADPETGGTVLNQKITKAECAQVENALAAVHMSAPACANVAPTPAPAKCSAGSPVTLFLDDQESGGAGWTESVDPARYTVQHWTIATDFASSGTRSWRANDELTSCSSGDFTSDMYLVSPEVNLAGATAPVLRVMHDFFTEGGYDAGTFEININGNWVKLEPGDFTLNPYNGNMNPDSTAPNWTPASRRVFTGYRHPGDFPALTYYESRVNLSTYLAQDADKTIQFRFRFATDFCNGTNVGWYIDDVEVYECR